MKTRTLLTADDYFALPDDGKQYELLAGELYVNPTPSFPHQDVAKRLFLILQRFFEGKGLGEVFFAPLGVVLGPHDVAEPDLMVVADPSQFSQRGIEGRTAAGRRDPVAVQCPSRPRDESGALPRARRASTTGSSIPGDAISSVSAPKTVAGPSSPKG